MYHLVFGPVSCAGTVTGRDRVWVSQRCRTPLRGARSAAGEKVVTLRGTNYAEPVGRVAGAVQGGSAAAAAVHCQDALSATFTEWCAEAQRLADNLGVAADRYQQGDHTATGVFPSATPTMHEPR
ncbi:type VII secretion target [Amycolatopsis panacis]|uniref:Uncharacterized protein n=1 Tax=Amycolatopsis panacis TaxID=2340917 RepID=A0A419IB71_9PSEU|nr:hypothetical protein D5S19_01990 [Amycolatopsis panacis]